MSQAREAMATWVGTLRSGGVLRDDREEAGMSVAAYVVGEERLDALRRWMLAQPPAVLAREQQAAIELCVWMAQADRQLHPEEVHLLRRLIAASRLPEDVQDALVASVHDPAPLVDIVARLTHPVLRELMVALMWELAHADGCLDVREEAVLAEACDRLGVPAARAAELKGAIVARVGET